MDQFFDKLGAAIYLFIIFGGSFYVAKIRGRNPWRWFFAAFIIHFFGLIFLLCSKPIQATQSKKTNYGSSGEAFYNELVALRGIGKNKASAVIAQYPTKKALTGSTIDSLSRLSGLSRTDAATIFEYAHWSNG